MNNPYKPPRSELGRPQEVSGLQFNFDIAGKSLIVEGGLGNGMERIYLDGEIVSERRSLSKISEHNVRIEGVEYTVILRVRSIFTNKIDCELKLEEKTIKHLRCEIKLKHSISIFAFLMIYPLFYVLGYIKSYFNISDSIDVVVYIVIFLVIILVSNIASKKGDKIISEVSNKK